MDPLMERQTRAIEEIANELTGIRELLTHPRKMVNMQQTEEVEAAIAEGRQLWGDAAMGVARVALKAAGDELNATKRVLDAAGVGSARHNVSCRVEELTREHKRAVQTLSDIEAALTDASDLEAVKSEIYDLLGGPSK